VPGANAVVDLDPINDRLNIGLAEGDVARRDLFPHSAAETLDRLRTEGCRRGGLRLDPVERGLKACSTSTIRTAPPECCAA
jgi:hypothetical protein